MNTHATEQEITESLAGTAGRGSDHVASCATCRTEVGELRHTISAARQHLDAEVERDEIFWARQRIAIQDRLPAARRGFISAQIVAAAVVLLFVAALLLARTPRLYDAAPVAAVHPVHAVQQATNDAADDLLLQSVANDVDRDVPMALAPAALMTQERNAVLSNHSASGVRR